MLVAGDFFQIGVVVRDIDEGMARYQQTLGVGPFWRLDTDYEGRYRNWRGRLANRNAFARWGNVYLEMVQPVIGEGNAREWLETRGEGIVHLGYATDDLAQRPADAECVFESWRARTPDGGAAVIHLDTVAHFGYFLELTYRPIAAGLNDQIDRELVRLAAAG